MGEFSDPKPNRMGQDLEERRARAAGHFAIIENTFDRLPHLTVPSEFSLGAKVAFPEHKNSRELKEWKVVRAEKGHYLLERSTDHDLVDHVVCSESDLLVYNPR